MKLVPNCNISEAIVHHLSVVLFCIYFVSKSIQRRLKWQKVAKTYMSAAPV